MYAGVILSLRHLRGCDTVWLVFLNHLVTALVLLPFVGSIAILPAGRQWAFLVCFGALQMALPYVIFAHEASLIGLLEPIMLPVWIFVAWRSSPDYLAPHWSTLVGGALILCGLMQRYAANVRARFGSPPA
jgi:hypothetical protein